MQKGVHLSKGGSKRRPNLLFIYTDEQALSTLAAYGNSQIEMPNLDRLARESIVFEKCYVTQPVCTPSRSTLLTGLYPHTNGCIQNNIPLRPDTLCLPEMIIHGTYVTAHYGKWHLGDELFAQHGFNKWVSIEDYYNSYFTHGRDRNAASSYHHFLIANGFVPHNGKRFYRGETARLPEQYSRSAFLAQEASKFIRDNKDNPFVLYVNFLEPHMPYFGPRDDQYDPDEIPLPSNFNAAPGVDQPLKTRIFKEAYYQCGHSGMPLKTEADWRRLIAKYWGLCSLIDTHIGKILETLGQCGLRDNTIVVFTSDHGDMMGSHRLLAKCVMFEEAIRVPFIIRMPRQTKAKRISGIVSQIDVVPTLLDLLGQPVPDHLQGKSLRKLIETGAGASRQNVFVQWNGPNTGIAGEKVGRYRLPSRYKERIDRQQLVKAITDPVRTIITDEGWKFNCSPLGEHELYNLNRDPGETENLFNHKKHKSVVKKLTEQIYHWQSQTADAVELLSP